MTIEPRRHGSSNARKPKALEDENRRLMKLLVESLLDVATLREMMGRDFRRLVRADVPHGVEIANERDGRYLAAPESGARLGVMLWV